jgi:hypothetical protein
MATKNIEPAPCAMLAPDLMTALLGPTPVLYGECAATFDALYESVRSALSPRDVIDEMWVREVVDIFWEAVRLRRARVKFLGASTRGGLVKLMPLLDLSPGISVKSLVESWGKRESAGVNYVEVLLEKAGLDQESILAETLVLKLDIIERIDRLIMQAESRRNAMLREMDRRRDGAAQRLRVVAAEIEDAEFQEIPSLDAAE